MLNKFNMLRFLAFVRNDISPYCDTVSEGEEIILDALPLGRV